MKAYPKLPMRTWQTFSLNCVRLESLKFVQGNTSRAQDNAFLKHFQVLVDHFDYLHTFAARCEKFFEILQSPEAPDRDDEKEADGDPAWRPVPPAQAPSADDAVAPKQEASVKSKAPGATVVVINTYGQAVSRPAMQPLIKPLMNVHQARVILRPPSAYTANVRYEDEMTFDVDYSDSTSDGSQDATGDGSEDTMSASSADATSGGAPPSGQDEADDAKDGLGDAANAKTKCKSAKRKDAAKSLHPDVDDKKQSEQKPRPMHAIVFRPTPSLFRTPPPRPGVVGRLVITRSAPARSAAHAKDVSVHHGARQAVADVRQLQCHRLSPGTSGNEPVSGGLFAPDGFWQQRPASRDLLPLPLPGQRHTGVRSGARDHASGLRVALGARRAVPRVLRLRQELRAPDVSAGPPQRAPAMAARATTGSYVRCVVPIWTLAAATTRPGPPGDPRPDPNFGLDTWSTF